MRLAFIVAIGLAVTSISSTASAQNRPTFQSSWSMSNRAQVISIDRATRMVELQRSDGERRRIHADDSIKNLDKVQPGDTVLVNHSETMTFTVMPPGTKPPPDQVTAKIDRAGTALPAAVATEKHVATRRVVSIDLASSTVSMVDLKGGPVMTHRVTDQGVQKDLGRVKPGDLVTGELITMTSISIERTR